MATNRASMLPPPVSRNRVINETIPHSMFCTQSRRSNSAATLQNPISRSPQTPPQLRTSAVLSETISTRALQATSLNESLLQPRSAQLRSQRLISPFASPITACPPTWINALIELCWGRWDTSHIHFLSHSIRQVSSYALLSRFLLPWPPPCCPYRVTPFEVTLLSPQQPEQSVGSIPESQSCLPRWAHGMVSFQVPFGV